MRHLSTRAAAPSPRVGHHVWSEAGASRADMHVLAYHIALPHRNPMRPLSTRAAAAPARGWAITCGAMRDRGVSLSVT